MLDSYEFDEDYIELIGSLDESTVYLLGDSELISLWEDAHERKLMGNKAQAQKVKITGTKPKMLGVVKNADELKSKLMAIGTPRQNRSYIRNNMKQRKEAVVDVRKQEKRMGLGKGDLTKHIPEQAKQTRQMRLNKAGLGALYVPSHKAIATTSKHTSDELIEHEKTHHKNNEWVRAQKGGHSKANKLFAKSAKATTQAVQGNAKNYFHDPLEYNAIKAAGGDKNEKEQREVLTKAIHGKKTPAITPEMHRKQFRNTDMAKLLSSDD